MTATDPRPALATALAAAYAEDANPEPPPPAEPDYDGSQDAPETRNMTKHDTP